MMVTTATTTVIIVSILSLAVIIGFGTLCAGVKSIIEAITNSMIRYRRQADDASSSAIFEAVIDWWESGVSSQFETEPLCIRLIKNRIREREK